MRRKSAHFESSRRSENGPPRHVLLLLICLLAILLNAGKAIAASVVVVKASEAEPYTQAEAALRARLVEHHDQVRTVALKEIVDKDISATLGKPELVIAIGTPAARWLQKQLPAAVKLVYCMVSNADDAGLMVGRDSWGVTMEIPLADQISVIAQALPNARKLGMLYHSDTAEGRRSVELMAKALPEGWRLETVAVNEQPSVGAAIDALAQKNIDIIWTSTDQKIYDTPAVRALLLSALRTKTPVWGFSPAFVRAGAVIGAGVEPAAQGRQAAGVALEALAGKCTAADKATPPREFQIAVNLIVAKQIGVEIPQPLIIKAAHVYRPEN
jgi:ABC-type uncharacterized transport system substrate-binding protein